MNRHAAVARAAVLWGLGIGLVPGLAGVDGPAAARGAETVVRVGAGSYLSALPPGAKGPAAAPGAPFVTADFKGPIPTNDWCSSLFWEPFSHPHYAHPLAMKATAAGLRVFYPGPAVAGTKDAIFGFMPDGKNDLGDLTIGHAAVDAFPEKRVAAASDWFVDVRWQAGPASTTPGRTAAPGTPGSAPAGDTPAAMTLSYGHGSPLVYAAYEGGGPRVTFAEVPKVWAGDAGSPAIGLTVGGKHYALYKEDRLTWAGLGTRTFTAAGDRPAVFRIAVALLPSADRDALDRLIPPKWGVGGSRVGWQYDPAAATVATTFELVPGPPGEVRSFGGSLKTSTALYPHQWRYLVKGREAFGIVPSTAATGALPADAGPAPKYAYPSVRGTMRLLTPADLGPGGHGAYVPTTRVSFPGVLPALPRVPGGADPARLADYLRRDVAASDDPAVRDTYAEGKLLGKWAALVPIAEQYGLDAEADVLTRRIKARLEDWFTAADAKGEPKSPTDSKRRARLFAHDPKWGTLIGYPASYGSDVELNDHHFHYGYFIRAAAEVARRDPAWAADDRWGGMVKLLIRDIASPDRADPLFPFLRNFDPYAGHSWASGHARFGDGNNHESSSEAMNAWAGVLLWGQYTGDATLRDLGAWLYTTEMTAIEDYWFGVHDDTFAAAGGAAAPGGGAPANGEAKAAGGPFPKGYTASVVTMVWGGKGANGTWFSGEPEAVHGINFLPITGNSTYLGRYPAYADKNWRAMLAERKGGPLRQWEDVLLMYRALSDPADALARFDAATKAGADGKPAFKPEQGNSLAATYHWIATLNAVGQVDRTVTADHPLAVTFVDKAGKRTHVAYAGGKADAAGGGGTPAKVTFSDGVNVEPKGDGPTVR